MISSITSKDNPKVKLACSLREKKYRKENKMFLGESKKSLELALKASLVKEVFTYEMLDIDDKIPQYLVNEEVMKKLSSSVNPEGVVFIAKIPDIKKDNYHKILFLDQINDPGNLGTMIRTALAFNFEAVVVSPNSVSIYNDKALAACKGANYLIPVFEGNLEEIKGENKIISSCLDKNAVSLSELSIKNNFILVMGNEAHGISKEVRKLTDVFVKIPISNIDSLNVGSAASILMYELSK